MISLATTKGMRRAFVPFEDAREATLLEEVEICPVRTLTDLVSHLNGDNPILLFTQTSEPPEAEATFQTNFSEIRGQEHVKRGLEVAAAGAHNVLMSGPPGSGKTLLAQALPSIMPPMSIEEALEVTKIYSVRGLLPADTPLLRERPFRSPITARAVLVWSAEVHGLGQVR